MAGESDGSLAHFAVVVRKHFVASGPVNALMMMHEHAVVKHGDEGRRDQSVFLKHGGGEDDVKGLPVAWWKRDVHRRGRLGIHGGALTVWIERFVIGIEDLDFIKAVQQDTIVAFVIPRALEILGHLPLEVKLEASKGLLGGW